MKQADRRLVRVEALTTAPVVGKRYLVRTVWNVPCGRYLPIIGPAHADPEISPEVGTHYHFDLRFISDRVLHGGDFANGQTHTVRRCPGYAYAFVTSAAARETRIRPLICHREMPAYPESSRCFDATGPERRPHTIPIVERLCAGKRLDLETMICPHRGIPLRGLPIDADGCVTCPGHGAKWDTRTGDMVLRQPIGSAATSAGKAAA